MTKSQKLSLAPAYGTIKRDVCIHTSADSSVLYIFKLLQIGAGFYPVTFGCTPGPVGIHVGCIFFERPLITEIKCWWADTLFHDKTFIDTKIFCYVLVT